VLFGGGALTPAALYPFWNEADMQMVVSGN